MVAEDAMLAMATKEFWVQAAQDNGVTSAADLAQIERFRAHVVADLQHTVHNPDFLAVHDDLNFPH
jgi:hypothetical protein